MKCKHQVPTASLFDEISGYWAELAQVNNTERQLNFVKNNVKPTGWVLDLGCGSGRHITELSKAGYDVVGMDVSLNLLRIAKSKAFEAELRVPLVRADMRFLPFQFDAFVATVSLDSSFGYLSSENEDLQVLKEIARTLKGRGFLLLDVFNRERLSQHYRKRVGFDSVFFYKYLLRVSKFAGIFKWKEYPSFYLLQKRSILKGEEKLRDLWIFWDKKTGKASFAYHVVRLYKSSQLDMMIKEAGLKVGRIDGNYEGQRYSVDSSRLIFVAQKTESA